MSESQLKNRDKFISADTLKKAYSGDSYL